jgi:hypothetical protein
LKSQFTVPFIVAALPTARGRRRKCYFGKSHRISDKLKRDEDDDEHQKIEISSRLLRPLTVVVVVLRLAMCKAIFLSTEIRRNLYAAINQYSSRGKSGALRRYF